MTLKEDVIAFGILAAAVVGLAWWAKNKIGAAIPQVVKDGTQAVGVLAGEAVNGIVHPLETFGVSPPASGAWGVGAPSGNTNDPVTNSDSGINFNLF